MSLTYHQLVSNIMLETVHKILTYIAQNSLTDERALYLTFDTSHPGIVISQQLSTQYPEEMTIILQHQYKDLTVFTDYFTLTLSFNNIEETIKVPFNALIHFFDPLMEFRLELNDYVKLPIISEDDQTLSEFSLHVTDTVTCKPTNKSAEIISIDDFRSKAD